MYEETKVRIVDEIKTALKHSKIGITADLWSETFTNIQYLGLVAHYISHDKETNKPSLMTRDLKLQALDADQPKTAEVLNEAVNLILKEFSLDDSEKKIVFITDRGKNIANAVKKDFVRRSCIDHFINNVTEHCCREQFVNNQRIHVIKVVKYLKCNGKSHNMSHHLSSFVKTRWNSLFDMLDSFLKVYDEIRVKISSKRKDIIQRFNRIDKWKLESIRDFLGPLKTLTVELESDQVVTSVKLLPAYEMLLDHLKFKDDDIKVVKEMKKIAAAYIEKDKHEVLPANFELWAFFHPNFKRLNRFKTIDKESIMDRIKTEVEMLEMEMANGIDKNSNQTTGDFTLDSTRSVRNIPNSTSIFSQYQDVTDPNEISPVSDEIDTYVNAAHGPVNNVLEWWDTHKQLYPRLYSYFMTFAAVPVSSASAERIFSNAHCLITEKRTRLTPQNIDMLVFLHKNA